MGKKSKVIFIHIILLINIFISNAQTSIRLDVSTENIEEHKLLNKIPNRVNYFSKSKNNKKKIICSLSTKDSAIIKKLSDYEYIIAPFFNQLPIIEPGLFVYESYKGKIIDSIWFGVLPEPDIKFFENTYKNGIIKFNQNEDGILDTLYFWVVYGEGYDRRLARVLPLNLKKATICLVNSNKTVIDSFSINKNYLSDSEKQRMRKIYDDKTKDYKFIIIKDILLEGMYKILLKYNYDIILTSKGIILPPA